MEYRDLVNKKISDYGSGNHEEEGTEIEGWGRPTQERQSYGPCGGETLGGQYHGGVFARGRSIVLNEGSCCYT